MKARYGFIKDLRYLYLVGVIALGMISIVGSNGGGDGDGEDDCATAQEIWGQPEVPLGGECYSGSYGACPQNYNNCIEGDCVYSDSANADICTRTCTSHSDCSDLGFYCSEGYCQPAATCGIYCDGTMCCDSYNDPNDPTQCIQGDCWFQ